MAGMPWMKWYTGAWLKDPAVRSLTPGARGLWIDLLCLMHESDRRGFLLVAGKAPSPEQLARMTGCLPEELSRLLTELEDSGVFSRTGHGEIYCRRMAREARISDSRADAGRKGAAAKHMGILPMQNAGKRPANGMANSVANGQQNPDISTLNSPTGELHPQIPAGNSERDRASDTARIAEQIYALYPRKVGKGAALTAIKRALAKVDAATLREAVAAYAKAREGQDPAFTPHPATWFNQCRWEDDRSEWGRAPQPEASRGAAPSQSQHGGPPASPNTIPDDFMKNLPAMIDAEREKLTHNRRLA